MSESSNTNDQIETRLSQLSEAELVRHNFEAQYSDKSAGFIGAYVPQFSCSDSKPTIVQKNSDILSISNANFVRNYLDKLDFADGEQFIDLDPPSIEIFDLTVRPMRIDKDVVIGFFIFFSNQPLSKTKIDWFIEYCLETIKLRKKSEALQYVASLSNNFPQLSDKNFYKQIAQSVSAAMHSAETLIITKNKKTLIGYTTAYSSSGNYIDVPEGVPSAVSDVVSSTGVHLNNDVFNVRGISINKGIVHNKSFFDKNGLRSFIAFSILSEDPLLGFSIFCFYKRPYAISIVERELFETICFVIEGLYRRVVSSKDTGILDSSEKLQKVLKQSLLIADVMHDATEDLVVVRNCLAFARTNTPDEKKRVDSAKNILGEIIDAARSFKDNIAGGVPTFQLKEKKRKSVNVREIISSVFAKYIGSGEYQNITFNNKVPKELQINAVAYTLRRAVDNAVKNSVKHLQDARYRSRTIEISTTRLADELIIDIYDNGTGMDEEQLDVCKELLHSTTGGMGFGMTIMEAAAIAHRGRIDIESELGQFCRVKLVLEYR